MNIADELAIHAKEELDHALQISNHVDYLGGMPSVTPKPVKTSEKAEDMLKFDLANEKETIRNYRRRVKQADALNEFAIAESLRGILVQEQDHLIALATALGIDAPDNILFNNILFSPFFYPVFIFRPPPLENPTFRTCPSLSPPPPPLFCNRNPPLFPRPSVFPGGGCFFVGGGGCLSAPALFVVGLVVSVVAISPIPPPSPTHPAGGAQHPPAI